MGPESIWFEYFDFDDSYGSRLPLEWDGSDGPGRSALHELQELNPHGDTHQHVDWFRGEWGCMVGKEMTDLDFRAFKLYLTRSMDLGIVPMYDLMNHHNGKINTYIKDDDEGGVYVMSLLDIPAGFPIYNTYGRSGLQPTNKLFTTYGFVEDYPQLWEWNDSDLDRIAQEKEDHSYHRYATRDSYYGNNDEENSYHLGGWDNRLNFEPNSPFYQVLVISPTLAALLPTKHLTGVLGNGQLSLEGWRNEINNHHATLRSSHVNALYDSAAAIMNSLPTTIEEDEGIIQRERRRLGVLEEYGTLNANDADVVMAIEYRLAFKKALRLMMEVATREAFFRDTDEL